MGGQQCVVHQFVVAKLVESALLGTDFLWKHQAIWDWKARELHYQWETPEVAEEETPVMVEQPCCLSKAAELQPESVSRWCLARVAKGRGRDLSQKHHYRRKWQK